MTDRAPDSVWDVVVVGAGPAGATAALAAAQAGVSVLLLERQELPRYKLCGGGLIGLSLSALPTGFTAPIRNEARSVTFSLDLASGTTREATATVIPMVMRSEFDALLVDHAVAAGATLQAATTVERVQQGDDIVELQTSHGPVRTRVLVGADGSASRVARAIGARYRQVDLGMEVELDLPLADQPGWSERVVIDFGGIPGAYGWIFPKGDRLTVGAIAAKGDSAEQRRYVTDLAERYDLAGYDIAHEGGHLTRCRAADSPLAVNRILLAGDAAGLLEPWTREGISFALRSGRLAGQAAAALATTPNSLAELGRGYSDAVESTMGREMAVGFTALAAYTRHPRAFYRALASTSPGWKAFERLSRGETTLARAGQHPLVRLALAALR